MYTVDDNNMEYEDEEVKESFWNNNKGFIIKIIIIILCVIVLIWLILALKGYRNLNDNGETHAKNVENMRLASENYFFKKGNMVDKGSKSVTVNTLKSMGLINDVVDANGRVCSEYNSKATLEREIGAYKMIIALSCSTNDQNELFYYNYNSLACLNCGSNTIMKGEDKETIKPINSDIDYDKYSCKSWSNWDSVKVNEPYLKERTRTLYKGVKYGKTIDKTNYGEWSDYTITPIESSANIEVEQKVVSESKWSDPKVTNDKIEESDKIKIISVDTISSTYVETTSCDSGYTKKDNTCYSDKEYTGDLTYREFNSGKYKVNNGLCDGVRTEKNSDGLYVLTYKNCRYNKVVKLDNKKKTTSYKQYTYQELEDVNVTYYRYRDINITKEKEPDTYTDYYYEEKNLPYGYEIIPSSKKIEYSYMISSCEK